MAPTAVHDLGVIKQLYAFLNLTSCALVAALTTAAFCAYRIWFHPLAKYPGPWHYKVSSMPLILQTRRGDRHLQLLRDHEKYGDAVRIAPNFVSFSSEEALNAIYSTNSANVRKSDWYLVLDSATGDLSTFSEVDKETHRQRRNDFRKAMASSFQSAEGENSLNQLVDEFCTMIGPAKGSDWSEPRNISDLSSLLGLEIISDIGYGSRWNALDMNTNSEMIKLSRSLTPAFGYMYWISYLPLAEKFLPAFMTSRYFELFGGAPARDNNVLIEQSIETVRNAPTGDRSFMQRLQKVVTKPETLYSESLSLINAAADPFSAHLSATLFYLLHNPAVLGRVTTEVRSVFTTSDEIRTGKQLNSCTYLKAIIEEAWRRAPAVLSPLPRQVLPGGLRIGTDIVPEGTIVGVPTYVIHHRAEYFPDPFAFRPERWIDPALKNEQGRKAFSPFGKGIRGCVASGVAYQWATLTLARIIFMFDMRLAPGLEKVGEGDPKTKIWGRQRVDEYQLEDRLSPGREGPWIQVRLHSTDSLRDLHMCQENGGGSS